MDFLWHLWQQKSKNSCDAGAYTRARRWFFRKVCTLKKQNWEKGKNDWETVGNEWQNLLASMQVSVKKTDVSFYRKQRVVLLKTTCRFTENNVLFCWIQRVVWTEIGEKEWQISLVLWEKSVGASAQRRWKCEVFGHVSGKAYFCTA